MSRTGHMGSGPATECASRKCDRSQSNAIGHIHMKTLAETLERDSNNFDLIRLGAALAVMFGHSFGVHGGNVDMEWMLQFTHRESFGSLAVYGFFLISGLLVSASYVNHASPLRFVSLRVMRIWPGAIACALFIGLVVGPLFTRLPLTGYFADPMVFRWLVHNASLVGGVGGWLPGVFEHNHLAMLVNPTFWTLPIELECYGIVLIVGLLGFIGSRWRTLLAVGVVGVLFTYFAKHPPTHITLGQFFIIPIAYSFYPVPFFLLGMLLYPFRRYIPLHWLPAVLLFAAYIMLRDTVAGTIILYPGFAYGLLWMASLPNLRRFKPRHDYSYGIYLYGFVVQQAITVLLPSLSNYCSVAIAIPITVVLAAVSWHVVECPCLALVRRNASSFAGVSPIAAADARA
ncbi:acyltransferase [Dyella sp. M7H15-1]|uniref:acyltransferase family protein n=1 Tax=Dyella sp. M7H15-1 TaxID=2501295 RepID=UPI0013E8E22D|nr:acyltransferase [Dyella sp. M7H15-1]